MTRPPLRLARPKFGNAASGGGGRAPRPPPPARGAGGGGAAVPAHPLERGERGVEAGPVVRADGGQVQWAQALSGLDGGHARERLGGLVGGGRGEDRQRG